MTTVRHKTPDSTTTTQLLSSFSYSEEKSADKIELPTFVLITNQPKKAKPKTEPQMKVLLLGNTQKNDFLLNLSEDSGEKCISTLGIEYKVQKVNGEQFDIWNTAGQERFQQMTIANCRNSSIILLFGKSENIIPKVKIIAEKLGADRLQGGFVPRFIKDGVILEQANLSDIPLAGIIKVSKLEARQYGNQLLQASSKHVLESEPQSIDSVDLTYHPTPSRTCCSR